MKGSGVFCESHFVALLNLPVGLLNSAKSALVLSSADLRDVWEDNRLPREGFEFCASALGWTGCVCERLEESPVSRAKKLAPAKLPERRKGLFLMKRGETEEGDEG